MLHSFTHEVFKLSNQRLSRIEHLRITTELLHNYTGCNIAELWIVEKNKYLLSGYADDEGYDLCFIAAEKKSGTTVPAVRAQNRFDRRRNEFLINDTAENRVNAVSGGGFWINAGRETVAGENGPMRSFACLPLDASEKSKAFVQLLSKQCDFFDDSILGNLDNMIRIIRIALMIKQNQDALGERVKELTCLYAISQLAERRDISLEETLKHIVDFIPPAWQYPEITVARIVFDEQVFATPDFERQVQKQEAPIVVKDIRRGSLEVAYLDEMIELDEGPFLQEERSLINAIARETALIIERREAEENSRILQNQLRHADRLATIGQLAAGVAHELNEPLGNILGFAQLTQKDNTVSGQVNSDLDKIINASLHAREVINKLMLFARQTTPKQSRVNLNEIVNEGLYFFEARCLKAGIELIRSTDPSIPEIDGDKAQIHQVLINLTVNAIQAMPDGGILKIETAGRDDFVILVVEDTGTGMTEQIIKKIFLPFFTTKDVNEGTGLGLAVVHGIVTSHKGEIDVQSQIGRGSRFEVRFPV